MVRITALATLALSACRDSPAEAPAPQPKPIPAPVASDAAKIEPPSTNDYVPAEYKSGMARWKDTVVYLDGKPIGYLTFGELPLALKPYWVKVKKSQNKPANCPECLAWKWGEQRYYRFTDYVKVMGIPLAKIKALHVQGPKITETIVATGADLMSPKASEFLFHFGGEINGKVLPRVPAGFANNIGPDKITAVMIYVTKTPPTFDLYGYVLDGKPIDGVPYYGEPLRGGVRVYVDDRLVAIIKRQDLDVKKAKGSNGDLSWGLFEFLKDRGVETARLVEGYVIRDDVRHEKIAASELAPMSFAASAQASGAIALGDKKLEANAIALYTRAIKPDELPQVRESEHD